MAKGRPSKRNQAIYNFFIQKMGKPWHGAALAVYTEHKQEIARLFNIHTYQSFNYHLKRYKDAESRGQNGAK